MISEERIENLLQIIRDNKFISYDDLASKTFCSSSTIRRDVNELVSKGLVAKVHGGVSAIEDKSLESAYIIRKNENTEKKNIIAHLASKYLVDGLTYFFDSSTTVASLTQYFKNFKSSLIVTNGINNALALSQMTNCEICLIGGVIQKNTFSTGGVSSLSFIHNINADICFISCKGLTLDGNITDSTFTVQTTKQEILKNSALKILLIDSSKFEKKYALTTAKLEDIDVMICETKPPEKIIEICVKNNVQLIYN